MTSQIQKAQIRYFKISAQRNLRTAEDLFKTKHYDSSLFFCHLTLEKILKGLVVQRTHQSAPYLHDLEKLAVYAGLLLDDELRSQLRIISTFNIAARYDDIKINFYQRCTEKYATTHLAMTKKIYIWLKKSYQKK